MHTFLKNFKFKQLTACRSVLLLFRFINELTCVCVCVRACVRACVHRRGRRRVSLWLHFHMHIMLATTWAITVLSPPTLHQNDGSTTANTATWYALYCVLLS